jgi:histidine triad (HIT) family protein
MVVRMNEDCLFCKIVSGEVDSKIIYEDELVLCCLDAYPNVSGHTLIIPKKHYTDYSEIPDDLLIHINKVANELVNPLMEKFNRDCLTFCVNYGSSQVIKHYHLHLLPGYGKKYINEPIISRDEAYDVYKG